jgi:hypothetical protein
MAAIEEGTHFSLPNGDPVIADRYAGQGWWRCTRQRAGYPLTTKWSLWLHGKVILGFMVSDLRHRATVLERLARRIK